MKKILLSTTLIVLLSLVITGIAMAQEPNPTPEPAYPGSYGGRGGYGSALLHDYMVKYMADAFGMQLEELNDRLEAGENLSQIAYALGLNAEEFYQLKVKARLNSLTDALTDGLITQEQYDFMQDRLENGQGMGMGFSGGGQGRGGRWQNSSNSGGGSHGNGPGFNPDCPYYAKPAPSN